MPERTIMSQLNDLSVWLAVLTALWGGLVSYFRRVQQGHAHSLISIAMHMTSSGFAGLLCWLGCVQFEVPPALTAICTGLAGHMGAEFIKILETRFQNKINSEVSLNMPPLFNRRASDDNPSAKPQGINQGRRASDKGEAK